jgi:rod shape-determining protein MreC
MVVLDRQGRLVGRVIEPITLKQSRVQLVTDEDSGVGVRSERFRVIGVLAGDGRGNCLMRYVLRTNREVETGESVITSGYDGIYPAGIPVGKVISISEDATVFKKIMVEPYFDFSDLDRVAVLAVDLRGLF